MPCTHTLLYPRVISKFMSIIDANWWLCLKQSVIKALLMATDGPLCCVCVGGGACVCVCADAYVLVYACMFVCCVCVCVRGWVHVSGMKITIS